MEWNGSSARLRREANNLFIVAVTAAPGLVGAGSVMRFAFPVISLAIAAFMYYSGRRVQYVTYILWLFFLTPFIRRLVDFNVGWAEPNYLMLAPYAALLPSVYRGFVRIARTRELGWMTCITVMIISVTYGFAVAALNGRPTSAGYDFLRWVFPICFAVVIAETVSADDNTEGSICTQLAIALLLIGCYTIYQFVFAPPWDTLWMVNSKMESIGTPFPFTIRAFGTLNSPGSFSVILALSLIMLFSASPTVAWPAYVTGLAALLLTLGRTAWGGLVLGMLVLFAVGTFRVRSVIAGVFLVLALGGPSLLFIPEAADVVSDRVLSITRLSQDTSFAERAEGYARGYSRLANNVLGEGLGIAGSYQSYLDGQATENIDGGPITIFVALGFPFGLVFIIAFVSVAFGTIGISASSNSYLAGAKAVSITAIALLWSDVVTSGEQGIFVWTAIGVAYGISSRGSNSQLAASAASLRHTQFHETVLENQRQR